MAENSILEKASDPHIRFRFLEKSDYSKGHLQILAQLTSVGNVTQAQYETQFNALDKNVYKIVVIEDVSKQSIIGSGTVFMEKKFIHECGKSGHIEDIVVSSEYRGKNLGLKLISCLTEIGRINKCYKIILDCSDKNVPFYVKCGYSKTANQMVIRFDEPAARL